MVQKITVAISILDSVSKATLKSFVGTALAIYAKHSELMAASDDAKPQPDDFKEFITDDFLAAVINLYVASEACRKLREGAKRYGYHKLFSEQRQAKRCSLIVASLLVGRSATP